MDGIAIVATPNQYYRKGGSNILGNRFDSAAMLGSQLTDKPVIVHMDISRFMAVSDKDGRLVIRNLPKTPHSSNFECWSTDQSSVVIKTNEALEGKLPKDDEHEVEYDVKVDVIKRKTIDQPAK